MVGGREKGECGAGGCYQIDPWRIPGPDSSMIRRDFLALAAGALGAPVLAAPERAKRRVAVIGHTGRGDYGHGLDTVWQQIEGVEIVGVADADETGLRKAAARLETDRGFRDYRRMLEEMKPEFVTVCPRHVDQHAEMALAAIEAGVKGIYVEKPFVRTPAEADQLVAACQKHGARIAVAHRNRYHPVLPVIDKLIADGDLGKLLEIRGRGKGDRRGGAEDLWVVGSHVMNLINYFGGDPRTCSAVLLQGGRHVVAGDLRGGPEGLGLLPGADPFGANELHGRYGMSNGVIATFDSIANDGTENAGFGLQLIGSVGIVNIQADRDPLAHFVPGNPFRPTAEARPWIPVSSGGVGVAEPAPELIKEVENHVVAIRDLIAACDEGRAPRCDVKAGATTVEMICGVFASHVQGGKAVAIPLEERGNALEKL